MMQTIHQPDPVHTDAGGWPELYSATRNRDPEPNRSNGLENLMSTQTVYVTAPLFFLL